MSCFSLSEGECLAITKCNTILKELITAIQIEVIGGEILKITRLASFGDCFVKIYSCKNKNLNLSSATYSCDYSVLKILNEICASMLISIPDRTKRLMIISSNETENFLMQLKLNDVVRVNKAVLKRDKDAVCIVKYIGPVSQIGPGTYIGFVLFYENDTINEKNHLAKQYFNSNGRNGFIRNCGCFFTRKFLLDQDTSDLLTNVKKSQPQSISESRNNANKSLGTVKKYTESRIDSNKLLIAVKKSQPKPVIVSDPLQAMQRQSTKPSAPCITTEQAKQPISYLGLTTNKTLYASPVPWEAANKSAEYPRQKYIAETASNTRSTYSPTSSISHYIQPIPGPSFETNKFAVYPRQQYITEPTLKPQSPYNQNSTIYQNTPRDDSAMCSTSNFADGYRSLKRGSEKVTIRRSIREGPKSTAKRIIFEETVIHKYSGDKKKKKCIIM